MLSGACASYNRQLQIALLFPMFEFFIVDILFAIMAKLEKFALLEASDGYANAFLLDDNPRLK